MNSTHDVIMILYKLSRLSNVISLFQTSRLKVSTALFPLLRCIMLSAVQRRPRSMPVVCRDEKYQCVVRLSR